MPPPSPMDERKFICDEMLKGLGRWLRIAGYDVRTEIDGAPDRYLIQQALAENCILLTRDRRLLQIRNARDVVILLEGNDIESQADEISRKLGVNWLKNPFSRCPLCNTPLVGTALTGDLPPDVEQAFFCPTCGKYYWQGGHVERMQQRLRRWQSAHT